MDQIRLVRSRIKKLVNRSRIKKNRIQGTNNDTRMSWTKENAKSKMHLKTTTDPSLHGRRPLTLLYSAVPRHQPDTILQSQQRWERADWERSLPDSFPGRPPPTEAEDSGRDSGREFKNGDGRPRVADGVNSERLPRSLGRVRCPPIRPIRRIRRSPCMDSRQAWQLMETVAYRGAS